MKVGQTSKVPPSLWIKLGVHAFSKRPKCPRHVSVAPSWKDQTSNQAIKWVSFPARHVLMCIPENFLCSHLNCWSWSATTHEIKILSTQARMCACVHVRTKFLLKNPPCLVPQISRKIISSTPTHAACNIFLVKSCQVGTYQFYKLW